MRIAAKAAMRQDGGAHSERANQQTSRLRRSGLVLRPDQEDGVFGISKEKTTCHSLVGICRWVCWF